MLIDRRLDGSSHVKLIKRKLLFACHVFFKICKFDPIDILRLLYFSFVHCHLQYCVISRGTANNSVPQQLSVFFFRLSEFFFYSLLDRVDIGAGVGQPFGRVVRGGSMDCTVEDDMVDGLFSATLTDCRGGQTTIASDTENVL